LRDEVLKHHVGKIAICYVQIIVFQQDSNAFFAFEPVLLLVDMFSRFDRIVKALIVAFFMIMINDIFLIAILSAFSLNKIICLRENSFVMRTNTSKNEFNL
jgi:hypothetical protein